MLAAGAPCQKRDWRPGRPVDLHATLGPLRRGTGDPVHRSLPDGSLWRTARSPAGPATLRLAVRAGDGVVEAAAWGAGADWMVDCVPALLGAGDDPGGFDPGHPLLRATAARYPGWRVPRSGLVLESLVPAVLEQKVTGTEARRAWRTLVQWYGDPAPGPAPAGMRVVPAPETWAGIPSWDWHRAGVEAVRARTIAAACRVARRIEETAAMPPAEAERRLRVLPGIGVWTAAEVRQRAHGDADAVSVGDFHLARRVTWALTGQVGDDGAMLALLQRWPGARYRVQRLVELSGVGPPRRGPRLAPRDYRDR